MVTTGTLKTAVRHAAAVALLASAVLASGCSRTERWQEEVRLGSGQVILVDRVSGERDASLRFSLPGVPRKVYEWHALHDGGIWRHENPLVLDVENGVPVIYTVVVTSPGCRLFTRYSNRNGAWVEEVLPDKFKGKAMNLFVRGGLDVGDTVTLDQKRRESTVISYSRSLKYLGPSDKACRR
ncbi:hypothetical protein SAMN05216552_101132 [Pseudoduganella namucuonensis]|uniref:Lipoprotein n=1 Tax=Pseudoduganella namucuonensis TaxID=1035707 RepID=A0A1I7JDU9_9BURK|nr:hypothetical protein SAMN05216552_101132 [Pseudoduganella namucuonensis]